MQLRLMTKILGYSMGLVLMVTGCGPRVQPPCKFGCFCRRPAVIASWEPWILDYNDCFQNCPVDLCGCGPYSPPTQSLTPDLFDPYQPIDPDYRLNKGDILEISVFGEEEASINNAMVAPDGKLYYTVLEGIPAVGRTPVEVGRDLSTALSHLLVEPKVIVVPLQTMAPTFKVLGRVRGPGEFPLTGPITVREGIFEAGGLLSEASKDIDDDDYRLNVPTADLDASFIVRGGYKLDVDFNRLFFTADDSQNIYLKPGDYIYIAGAEHREVFVLGYAVSPQRLPFATGMTLMSAITASGGWPTPSPYSPDLGRIVVVRGSLDCPRVCLVDVNKILNGQARDLYLCPGDIVYMAHKQWRTVRDLIIIAIDSFLNTFAISAASYYSSTWFTNGNFDDECTVDE